MVRGFALFGVMLVNMFNFGATSIIWTDSIDVAASSVMRFFFETKSWRLFSFLFGFGFALQMLRGDALQVNFLPTYLRRLAILFCIGMLHALFYDGDILMYYAELGLILILFRNVRANALLVVAAALLMAFPVERAITSLLAGPPADVPSTEVRLEDAQKRMDERIQTHPYAVGTVREVMAENAQGIPPNPFTDWRWRRIGTALLRHVSPGAVCRSAAPVRQYSTAHRSHQESVLLGTHARHPWHVL